GTRVLHPAVIAPFAGVIHVRLALLEQLAVTGEGVDPFRAGHVGLDSFLHPLLAVGPLDQDPFFLEQPLVIGDELGQSLERRRGLQDELFHGHWLRGSACSSAPVGGACSSRVVGYDCAASSTTSAHKDTSPPA